MVVPVLGQYGATADSHLTLQTAAPTVLPEDPGQIEITPNRGVYRGAGYQRVAPRDQ